MTGSGPVLGLAGAATAESGLPPLKAVQGAPYPPYIILLNAAEDIADEADAIARRADDLAGQAADVAEFCAEARGETCIEINNRNDNRNELRNIDRDRIGGVVIEPTSTALRVNPAAARLAHGAVASGAVSGSTDTAGLITAEARRIVAEARRIAPEAGRIAGEAEGIVGLAAGVNPKAEQVASGAVGRAETAKKKASDAGRIALQVARTPLGKNARMPLGENARMPLGENVVEDDDCRGGDCGNESVGHDCGDGGRPCEAGGESLPFTGVPATASAGLGAGLLVAGAGVLWLVRRRRSTGAK
ncbi:hypothetical protein ACSDR0_19355 [Streptosporangium sp. G11]|uniref:hypothetical protein n=1 Tax=Streptosporangium sp. G11 TaxID=3436926 RepID=UPI003EC06478